MTPNGTLTSKVELTPMRDGRNWQVDKPFSYKTPTGGKITVPKGFVTDLASIPRLFWNILPPFGKYTDAAVVHDYLYRTQQISREESDLVLKEIMQLCRCPRWQVAMIYWNVRLFGQAAWNDDKRRFHL